MKPITNNNKTKTGETELPHQPDDVRPEGIKEYEQEPPEEIITPDDYDLLPYNELVQSAELTNDDPELQKLLDENRTKKIAPPPPAKPKETHLIKTENKPRFLTKFKSYFNRKNNK